eukprot:1350169-Pyramimonas_sp.AAC.1
MLLYVLSPRVLSPRSDGFPPRVYPPVPAPIGSPNRSLSPSRPPPDPLLTPSCFYLPARLCNCSPLLPS